MDRIKPKVPVDYNVLKQEVRQSLSDESRTYWWPVLPNVVPGSYVDSYPDIVASAKRLKDLLKEPLLEYAPTNDKLNETDAVKATTKKLLYVLNSNKLLNVEDANCVYSYEALIKIVVHQIKRVDVCYVLLNDLLGSRERYIDPDFSNNRSMAYTFKEMLSSFMPKTYNVLVPMGALDDKYLDMIFLGFFTELLPCDVVMRLFGSFLLEGAKILFRYGLALIRGYKAQIKAKSYNTATDFWLSVKADAVSKSNAMNKQMLYKTLALTEILPAVDPFIIFSKAKNKEFLNSNKMQEYPFDMDRSVFEKFRRPMNISSSTIRSMKQAADTSTTPSNAAPESAATRKDSITRKGSVSEMASASASNGGVATIRTNALQRRSSAQHSKKRVSLWELSNKQSAAADAKKVAGTAREETGEHTVNVESANSENTHTVATKVVENADEEDDDEYVTYESKILDADKTQCLLSYLPDSDDYDLVFATHEHGYSLSTLYSILEGLSPCVLLVQLAEPYDGVVLGAYLSESLAPPTAEFRGDQYTRVFRLDEPNQRNYPWIGLVVDPANAVESGDTNATQESSAVKSAPVRKGSINTLEAEFAIACQSFISFGGSEEHGTVALRMDDDMQMLYTGVSDTFGNPPLVVPDGASLNAKDHHFAIKHVEVFCGAQCLQENE